MSKEITFREFESINSFSNANIERILRAYINESANASLVSTFDDGAILFDVNEEKFYSANFSLDKENLQFTVDNYEELELVEDDKFDFKLATKEFFLDEEKMPLADLKSGYGELVDKPIKAIEKIIAESVADKDFENSADFEELSFINEEFTDLHEEDFFKFYKKRLGSHPLSDVLVFNWKDPVSFSLYESTEPEKYLNSKGKEKAKLLFKNKKFKKKLAQACMTFKEDVEAGGEKLFELYEENPSLFYLPYGDLRENLARVLITSPELQDGYKDLLEGVGIFLNESADIEELKYSILGEAIDIGKEKDDDEGDYNMPDNDDAKDDDKEKDDDEDKKDDKKEEKAKELTAEEKEKIVSALKKVVEKSLDEKIKEMAQDLLDKFDNDDEGTKPEEVKEAVRFLSVSF